MKRKLRYGLSIGMVFLLAGAIALSQYWRSRDFVERYYYDRTHSQETVSSKKAIQSILAEFERVPYAKLDPDYLRQTASDEAVFRKMLSNKHYYLIPGDAIYRKIVGDYRIADFLPKDQYYRQHVLDLGDSELYWLVDPKLLYAFLQLQQELAKQGYQSDAFVIYNGYRHPAYNRKIGGANRSRHILGQAVDISIRDINGDGRSTKADKEIVLDILDRTVIGNRGGLGRYPGTMSVHFDVRGRRARWDQQ
ncbi:MAG: D-Ala-D-Ala carboxypeptidase family metallohydrolase [Bacteroidota bacterium]